MLIDLCCDHGAIGRAAIEEQRVQHVLFNDIHPDIMQRLDTALKQYGAEQYSLSVEPAQELLLPKTDRGLVMLAGVGDEQTIQILRALLAQPNAETYQFIISPATKVWNVRAFLKSCKVHCLADSLVCENGRCYEMIHVIPSAEPEALVDPFGTAWQPDNADHQASLKKLIRFYSDQLKQGPSDITEGIISGYRDKLSK